MDPLCVVIVYLSDRDLEQPGVMGLLLSNIRFVDNVVRN